MLQNKSKVNTEHKYDPEVGNLGYSGLLHTHRSKIYGTVIIKKNDSHEILVLHYIIGKLNHKLAFGDQFVLSTYAEFSQLIETALKPFTQNEKALGILKTTFRRFKVLVPMQGTLTELAKKYTFQIGLSETDFLQHYLTLNSEDKVLLWAKYSKAVEEFEKKHSSWQITKKRFTKELIAKYGEPPEPIFRQNEFGNRSLKQLQLAREAYNQRLLEAGAPPELPASSDFIPVTYFNGQKQEIAKASLLGLFNPVNAKQSYRSAGDGHEISIASSIHTDVDILDEIDESDFVRPAIVTEDVSKTGDAPKFKDHQNAHHWDDVHDTEEEETKSVTEDIKSSSVSATIQNYGGTIPNLFTGKEIPPRPTGKIQLGTKPVDKSPPKEKDEDKSDNKSVISNKDEVEDIINSNNGKFDAVLRSLDIPADDVNFIYTMHESSKIDFDNFDNIVDDLRPNKTANQADLKKFKKASKVVKTFKNLLKW